jgi:hypothetical protein
MSAANQGFGSIRHLAVRFFGSLRPGGPSAVDDAWAVEQLLPAERTLWARMSGPDRRHAVGVARDAVADLLSRGAGEVPRPVAAAALLHDVGKIDAGLGTWSRVAVTIVSMVVGRDRVAAWSRPPAAPGERAIRHPRSAAGRYVTHDRLGAALLRAAQSDPLTVAWAAEHHAPSAAWTLDRPTAEALKAADGD